MPCDISWLQKVSRLVFFFKSGWSGNGEAREKGL